MYGGEKVEELYKLYFKDIYRYMLAMAKNEHIAEEITQETFFKAIKNVEGFKGDCDVRTWLCQIAKNTYFSFLKKKNRCVSLETEEEKSDSGDNLCTGVNLEQNFVDKEQAIRIHKILHNIEEPYKEVFHLRVFGELAFKEIGDVFGKSESWARVTFHRAKSKVKNAIEKQV